MRLRYLADAKAEVREAMAYYRDRSKIVARNLRGGIADNQRIIREFPEAWHPLPDGVRAARIRGFPYSLVYCIRTDEVVIVAFAHHSRRPGYWMDRLREIR